MKESRCLMTDFGSGIAEILKVCLELPRSRETEIREHAARLLASIKAGDPPEALRMQVAKIQKSLGDAINDAACREAVVHARAFLAKTSTEILDGGATKLH